MKVALALVVLVLAAVPAAAAPEDVAYEIFPNVMSPFCPGVTLQDCPSDAADDLRAQITEWARAGWSRDQIMAELESEYGPGISALPPADERGIWAWVAPIAALIAGAAAAWRLTNRWSRGQDASDPKSSVISAEDRARLEMELQTLREQT